MTDKNKLYVNDGIFGFGGVMGRGSYLRNVLILFFINFFLTFIIIIAAIFGAIGEFANSYSSYYPYYSYYHPYKYMFDLVSGMGVIGLFCGLWFIASAVVGLGLFFRRVRDIRGTTDDEVFWFLGLIIGGFIIGLIPVINVLYSLSLCLFLFIKKGVVTSPDALTLQEFWAQVTGGNKISNNSGNNYNIKTGLVTLEKLYELKQKGAISEEEYNKAKEKLISGI